MTELSFSNTSNSKNDEFSSNLFSTLFNFCFSIFSHPLYFSYFIFFSPYLFKLLSFLSPLFITTTLLLVALLTFTPTNLVHEKCGSDPSESKCGILFSLSQHFLHSKADEKDEETGLLGEVEAYLVMFQSSIFEAFEPKSVEDSSQGFDAEFLGEEREVFCVIEEPIASVNLDENKIDNVDKVEENPVKVDKVEEVKSLESLFQENEVLEDMSSQKEEKEVKTLIAEFNKVEESKEKWPKRSGSKVIGNRGMFNDNNKASGNNSEGEYAFGTAGKVKSLSQRLEANIGSPESNFVYSGKGNLGSFGSMRVEKEWRRTLACKLFEERHNADGNESEGMDMLWETYETESNKVLQKSSTKKGKKGEVEDSEDEEEEEEDLESKLCCLQALKFSAGKMNLGMGRPNLLKFSKALKGIGWLHHVGKHGRKSNH
ncbi:hypothetical protein RJT34_16016 [Clitoria ternatea]|uniref:Uncharacterized protein n=1 Tax=Clitoria ternatea TaxID=43366 RepID=A0AAN9J6F6_CLITE